MADTPEKKVKRKVIAILKKYGAYYAMPVASGFGNAGVPDILVCARGKFIGIECKANGNKCTALQLSNLDQIERAGGEAYVVNEENLHALEIVLKRVNKEAEK